MKIISYASGGLGNRILPLASCHDMAKKTGRSLAINWEPSRWCNIKFDKLFSNNIENIDLNSLDLKSTVVYADYNSVVNECTTNTDRKEILNIANIVGCKPINSISNIFNENVENIIVYWCDIIKPFEDVENFFSTLELSSPLKHEVEDFSSKNLLDKSVYGVHLRGTDFRTNLEQYDVYIQKAIEQFKDSRFFICSDESSWEEDLKKKYGNRIIIRDNKTYAQKKYSDSSWVNNVYSSEKSIIDAMIDMILLSRTTILIHHKDSSFSKCAKHFNT
jgi:hypothetical protein